MSASCAAALLGGHAGETKGNGDVRYVLGSNAVPSELEALKAAIKVIGDPRGCLAKEQKWLSAHVLAQSSVGRELGKPARG